MRQALFIALSTLMLMRAPSTLGADPHFELQESDQGVTVNLNGQLFTRYLTLSGSKPILYPLIGPHGEPVTRAYPMAEVGPHEKADHPHHRSLWFTHGDVNGISFWEEPKLGKFGMIRHRRFTRFESGAQAELVAESDWLVAEAKPENNESGKPLQYTVDDAHPICREVRTMTFGADDVSRWIDFDIVLTAVDGPVKFGDTKEGSFGLRVAGAMSVDEKLGGKIVNREQLTNADAWGKRSPWVDYHGPVTPGGEVVGIAILQHPTAFRFPTYWHVRTYGLFAANPFGAHNFENSNEVDGSFVLEPHASLRSRYRVVLHVGDEVLGGVEQHYQRYQALE